LAYHGLENPEQALADYDRDIDRDLKVADVYYMRGSAYSDLDEL
jgi:hypothetical protein